MNLPKLLILDVDGVLTDGTKEYIDGNPVSKRFNDRDFTAIKMFKALGVKVCFLTADQANKAIAYSRGIDYFESRYNGMINKEIGLTEILKFYNLTLIDEIWAVGDDLFDIPLLKKVTKGFCPADAAAFVKQISIVIPANGGRGVVMCLAESYIPKFSEIDYNKLLEIDKNEKWHSSTR